MKNKTLHLHMRTNNLLSDFRTLIIAIILLLLCLLAKAQAPKQFSFQGVARDAAGKVVANQLIRLRLTIYKTAPNSNIKFEEEHTPITNINGVFTIPVGSAGMDLSAIDWKESEYYLQVEIDPTSGNNFIDLGTTQLLSVPYALHAAEANKLKNDDPIFMTGNLGQGALLPVIPGQSKFIWYPRKAAFRFGFENTGVWDDAQIGNYSFAFGNNSSATGEASFAGGLNSIASGNYSMAFGEGAVAKARGGVAFGRWGENDDDPDPKNLALNDRIFQIGDGNGANSRHNVVTILRNGKVGIGASDPDYTMDLRGRMRIRYFGTETAGIFFNTKNGNPDGFVGMKTDTEVGLYLKTWKFWVNDQGNGYLNGNLIQTSDRRLKTNIQPFKNSLGKVNGLQGYHYNWEDKTRDQTMQTGLIAQEVEQVFPELVSTNKDGFKSVNYIGLVPHLIESVKELKSKTDEIAVLRKELEGMREMGKRLELLEASLNKGAGVAEIKTAAK
ncbi:tail fiber domain-containing protein [Dyadobacter fanqingshengii]|uniref:Tail fiber domain-containing protein n=1 Tax=Dyadobacter fanqingshengii TaxID=2906443 RepID=A0A9X1PAI9_9BACT|nr:tail fiber domain-containing protein [Dyadobacter fanqingshengii]MCF0041686.1 tail fiber domain-containing protein [Dyadobacter fanqingshengii]USJ36600.1 tail fiber domain-containing protein [Dyadobacter fanqingshengii]